MTTPPPTIALERRRTGWDVLFGILSVVAGIIVLSHVALAGVISVLFTGWMLLIGGVVLAVGALVNWSDPPRRWNLATGGLIGMLGFSFINNPGIGLATLTLLAGSLLFVGGILRLVLAFQPGMPKGLLLFSGLITLALSLLVLTGWPASALWFLGTVLGVELIIDGITTALTGRMRLSEAEQTAGATA
ncbi:MAG: sulfate permease [Nitriliruptor sp.]|nr:MAG: sulfate permease [Nitriliruptor sp.]